MDNTNPVCFDDFAKGEMNNSTDANPQNATHPFTWKGCNFWVVAIWREYEILKKIFIVNEI